MLELQKLNLKTASAPVVAKKLGFHLQQKIKLRWLKEGAKCLIVPYAAGGSASCALPSNHAPAKNSASE